MPDTRKVLAVTACGAGAALALLLVDLEREAAASPTEPSAPAKLAAHAPQAEATAELNQQLHRLQRELGALTSRVNREAERARETADEVNQEEQAQEEVKALGELDPAAVRGHYEQLFDEQATDATWSDSESQLITQHFASGAVTGIALRRVDCRASMCRVELHVEDDERRTPFLRDIGLPPFQHGGYYHNDLESEEIVLFTAREGLPLPMYTAGS